MEKRSVNSTDIIDPFQFLFFTMIRQEISIKFSSNEITRRNFQSLIIFIFFTWNFSTYLYATKQSSRNVIRYLIIQPLYKHGEIVIYFTKERHNSVAWQI